MKRSPLRNRLSCFFPLILAGAACLLTLQPARADADPLRVQSQSKLISITSSVYSAVITQGEPITLRYKIENNWGRDIVTTFRLKGKDWLYIRLVRADGTQIKPVFFKSSDTIDRNPAVVGRQDHLTTERVIPKWETPLLPGTYQLQVSVQLPYMTMGPNLDLELISAGQKSILKTNFSFPITITAADAERLTKVAQEIKGELLLSASRTQIERLFSLPPAYYRPVMAELARTPDVRLEVRRALRRQSLLLNDAEAADLLATMAWEVRHKWGGEAEAEWPSDCLSSLRLMHKRGDASLKRHIEEMFARHQSRFEAIP